MKSSHHKKTALIRIKNVPETAFQLNFRKNIFKIIFYFQTNWAYGEYVQFSILKSAKRKILSESEVSKKVSNFFRG